MLRSPAYLLILLLLVSGCAGIPAPGQRLETADRLAAACGWQRHALQTRHFLLTAYLPQPLPALTSSNDPVLTVYIEGDGLAWAGRAAVSDDPTPVDPVGLRLALQHPDGAAAYLARPCQYIGSRAPHCRPRDWTSGRFSADVVEAGDQALSQIKAMTGAAALRLVGYSGGGAVATLLAARRADVTQLVTVAGNLDHAAWTKHHRISPLSHSLNPKDVWPELVGLRQTHLVGGKDRVISPQTTQNFAAFFPAGQGPEIVIYDDYGHHCCWAENWPEIYRRAVEP